MKLALAIALLLALAGCASAPLITCPDIELPTGTSTQSLPACEENLAGCFAYQGGIEVLVCQPPEWVPVLDALDNPDDY